MRSFLLCVSVLALLTACGTKGPLTLPAPVAKSPPADNSSKVAGESR